MTQPQIVLDARQASTPISKKIAEVSNGQKIHSQGAYGIMIAQMVFQTVSVSVNLVTHAPGSKAGEKFLNDLYDAAKADAIERWHAHDLQVHFGRN